MGGNGFARLIIAENQPVAGKWLRVILDPKELGVCVNFEQTLVIYVYVVIIEQPHKRKTVGFNVLVYLFIVAVIVNGSDFFCIRVNEYCLHGFSRRAKCRVDL